MAKPRKTPTFKQKQFAKAYVKHKGNASKAALEVYDTTPENAKFVGYQNINKPVVKKEIKEQLELAGLGLDDLTDYSKKIIVKNMEGKPSQAVAASMIQFAYKLHNVLPASKKMTVSMNLHDEVTGKDFDEVKKLLEEQNKLSKALLDSMDSKR